MSNNTLRTILLGLSGFLLVMLAESDLIVTEVVILMAFLVNLSLLYSENLMKLKKQIGAGLAAFIFGALAGIIIN